MPPRRRQNRVVKAELNSQAAAESESEEEVTEGEEESDEEVEEVEEDEEDEDSQSASQSKRKGRGKNSNTQGKGASSSAKQKSPAKRRPIKEISGPVLNMEEMVHNTLLYLLLMQHKKLPIKRSEIVKHALNSQTASFPEVMEQIKGLLDQKFGINLIGIEESRGRIKGCSSFILVSKYPMVVTESANVVQNTEDENKRSILYLILAVIFMLSRPLDEGTIWKIISDLDLDKLVCKKRDDLHRFLKQEYVSKMYLNVEEVKESDEVDYRYTWGLRSEKEFSKYSMLKFVTKHFPGKIPEDFSSQFGIAMEEEREAVEADRLNENSVGDHEHDQIELDDDENLANPSNPIASSNPPPANSGNVQDV